MKWIKTYESIQSQKLLDSLVPEILKLIAKNTFQNHIKEENGVKFLTSLGGARLSELDSSKYDKEAQQFFKDSKLYISPRKIRSSRADSTTHGQFDRTYHSIYLNLTQDFLDTLNEKLANPRVYGEHTLYFKEDDLYFSLWYEYNSILLHELQHAWDNWKSKGEYTRNKKFFKYVDKVEEYPKFKKEKEEAINSLNTDDVDIEKKKEEIYIDTHKKSNAIHKYYLRMQHEINARFTQAIKKVKFWTYDKSAKFDINNTKRIKVPFKDVLKDFTYEFEGWKDMTPKVKLKLTKRLAQFWTNDWDKREDKKEDENE
jgi:hypothetical protein